MFCILLLASLLSPSLTLSADTVGISPPAIYRHGHYVVPKVGKFTTAKTYTFETNHLLPLGLVAWSGPHDPLPNKSAKYEHTFLASNVHVNEGFLRLKVPGGQTKSPYKGAQVVTKDKHIHHASVRTYGIFSKVPGVVNANFYYGNNTQEIAIEYLTDPNSESLIGGELDLQYVIHNTQEDFARGSRATTSASAVHEYRIDWVRRKAMFYLDGVLQETFVTNIPTKPGRWIWNNWSSGSPGFTVGPPAKDSIFKIQKIVMYYNSTRHNA